MEVDGDRITDDERMDEDPDRAYGVESVGEGEDYPVGEGEGMMEDEDGDETMGDELQDDEEYEVAMEEENVEPIIDVHAQPEEEGEPVEAEPAPAIETPPIPFTSTSNDETSQPIVSPFPDISSVNSRTVLPRPLESPPAPETEMTPVEEQDEQPFINDLNGDEGTEDQPLHDEHPFISAETSTDHNEGLAQVVKDKVPSPQPEQVATTQQALEVLQQHPLQQEQDDMTTIPSVPEPQTSTLQVGESSKRGGSREPTPEKTQQGEHEEYYEDGEEDEEEEEEYVIDANSLPPIILHLANDQARYLFETYENDPDTLPVWLEGRQAELAEASLSDVWNAIKVECTKEGLAKNGALVVSEKQMDLKMNEDDVNLQSITFLELILLHHGCGLPEPVQLYLTWEESRFITRFNAIQTELEAMRRRSESVQAEEKETAQDSKRDEQQTPKAVEKIERTPQTGKNNDQSQKVIPDGEDDEYVDEYNEDDYVEEEEIMSKQGAYSDDEVEEKYRHKTERDGRRDQRDVKAQYAESVDDEVNTRDLERAHPDWAAARMKPTDALHFEGPTGKRYLNYKAEGHHQPEHENEAEAEDEEEGPDQETEEEQQVQHAAGTKEPDTKREADAVGEEGDYADEEQYDDEEEEEEEREDDVEEGEGDQWNDGVDDNNSTIAQSKDTDTQDEMNDVTVPQPFTVPKDELDLLKDKKAILTGKTVQQLQREEGIGEQKAIESSLDVAALPTPYASAAPSVSGLEVEASTQDTKFDPVKEAPLDEVALHRGSEVEEESTFPTTSGISTPAITSLTPSGMDEARAIARHVSGRQLVEVIPEEDESLSKFAERINEDDERGELAAPVPGGPAIGIAPDPDEGFYEDGEYEDTKIDNGPDTVPVTPMKSELEEKDLEFFDSTNGDEDEAYGSDEEGTLEADSTDIPDQLELTEETEDTLPSISIDDSTGTEVGSGSGLLSAKRHNEDESSNDVESKRARASTSD
uniref:Uncharacterized protein n=1 Tax=Kwoniella bestiolae CBS 10118 TaxID=1296100 RepID=A0A1B9FR67_9TREE|nr:hypothetical protein I302_08942 [Kwoniella bestiolae CBS 10118]OCF21270.1 hypothetical protein I302_08942 [Kwoniella bestiolae CBS 10118]